MSAEDMLQEELDRINEQLNGYEALLARKQQLSQALAILKGEIAPAVNSAPVRARRTRQTSPGSIDSEAIIAILRQASEPVSAVDIRHQLGLDDGQSNALSIKLKALTDGGQIVRLGERRSSRYVIPAT
jgi:hypothetical protein